MSIIKIGNTQINPISLSKGAHDSPEQGMCIMEMIAMLSGSEHSDKPPCTSPAIGVFCICINDMFKTDAERNEFFAPLALRMIGTNQPEVEKKRAFMCADFAVRTIAPIVLREARCHEQAEKLEKLKPVTDVVTARSAANAAANANAAVAVYAAASASAVAVYASDASDADTAVYTAKYAASASADAIDMQQINVLRSQLILDMCALSDGLNPERDAMLAVGAMQEMIDRSLLEYS